MGEAMSSLRTHQPFLELMQALEHPLLGILVAALFTALVQSSSATISLVVVMATRGFVTLDGGIPIVFGARVGTCITAMLATIGKPRQATRHMQLLGVAMDVESLGNVISRELVPVGQAFMAHGFRPSESTGELLDRTYRSTCDAVDAAFRAVMDENQRAAQDVLVQRESFWRLGEQVLRQQAQRLALDDPDRLLKHRLQTAVIDKLRRIYMLAEHLAVAVLPESVVAGEYGAQVQ